MSIRQPLRHLPIRAGMRAICVVEEVADLWALDRARLFTGRYHVLGGRLSALDGVRPRICRSRPD
jgi:recombination protein RecR